MTALQYAREIRCDFCPSTATVTDAEEIMAALNSGHRAMPPGWLDTYFILRTWDGAIFADICDTCLSRPAREILERLTRGKPSPKPEKADTDG